MKLLSVLLLVIISLTACNNTSKDNLTKANKPSQEYKIIKEDTASFIYKNNLAHLKQEFLKKDILSANIKLVFGGVERLNATLLYATKTGKTKIVYRDSSELTFNGKKVFLSPKNKEIPSARFDIFTWSYFLALPYKIDDKGTILKDFGHNALNGKQYNSKKLYFESNIGDSPDDWYVLYQDKKSNLLHAASYIVTLNKSIEEGEKDPHAIVYSDYKSINNIPIAHRWDFYGWTAEEGLTDSLGYAKLSNIKFIDGTKQSFEPQANAREIVLP